MIGRAELDCDRVSGASLCYRGIPIAIANEKRQG